jgi:hypothetical protein
MIIARRLFVSVMSLNLKGVTKFRETFAKFRGCRKLRDILTKLRVAKFRDHPTKPYLEQTKTIAFCIRQSTGKILLIYE